MTQIILRQIRKTEQKHKRKNSIQFESLFQGLLQMDDTRI